MNILSTISVVNLQMMPQDAAYSLKNKSRLCFLDSSLYPNKYSKFSYVAWDPKFTIKSYGYKNEFTADLTGMKYYSYQHPLSFLKENIKNYTSSSPGSEIKAVRLVYINGASMERITGDLKKKLPDFKGGFTGYFSYDLKNYIERLPQNAVDDIGLPIFYLNYYDRILAYSHGDTKWYLIRNFLVRGKKEEKNEGVFEAAFLKSDYVDPDIKDRDLIKKVVLEIEDVKSGFGDLKDIRKKIVEKYYKKKKFNLNILNED